MYHAQASGALDRAEVLKNALSNQAEEQGGGHQQVTEVQESGARHCTYDGEAILQDAIHSCLFSVYAPAFGTDTLLRSCCSAYALLNRLMVMQTSGDDWPSSSIKETAGLIAAVALTELLAVSIVIVHIFAHADSYVLLMQSTCAERFWLIEQAKCQKQSRPTSRAW